MVMPCQGNKLSGGGHSILHRVSDLRRYVLGELLKNREKEAREARKGLWADPGRWSGGRGKSDSRPPAFDTPSDFFVGFQVPILEVLHANAASPPPVTHSI